MNALFRHTFHFLCVLFLAWTVRHKSYADKFICITNTTVLLRLLNNNNLLLVDDSHYDVVANPISIYVHTNEQNHEQNNASDVTPQQSLSLIETLDHINQELQANVKGKYITYSIAKNRMIKNNKRVSDIDNDPLYQYLCDNKQRRKADDLKKFSMARYRELIKSSSGTFANISSNASKVLVFKAFRLYLLYTELLNSSEDPVYENDEFLNNTNGDIKEALKGQRTAQSLYNKFWASNSNEVLQFNDYVLGNTDIYKISYSNNDNNNENNHNNNSNNDINDFDDDEELLSYIQLPAVPNNSNLANADNKSDQNQLEDVDEKLDDNSNLTEDSMSSFDVKDFSNAPNADIMSSFDVKDDGKDEYGPQCPQCDCNMLNGMEQLEVSERCNQKNLLVHLNKLKKQSVIPDEVFHDSRAIFLTHDFFPINETKLKNEIKTPNFDLILTCKSRMEMFAQFLLVSKAKMSGGNSNFLYKSFTKNFIMALYYRNIKSHERINRLLNTEFTEESMSRYYEENLILPPQKDKSKSKNKQRPKKAKRQAEAKPTRRSKRRRE